MDEKDFYTKEDVLEVLVEENRKFRREIMLILYRLILGMVLTVLIVAFGFVSVTHIYFYSPSDYSAEIISTTTNTNENKNINTNESTLEEWAKKGVDE